MIFKYLKASGEYSIIFCPFEISKSSFFSIDLIFVLIVPDEQDELHLNALSLIAGVLQDEKRCVAIREARSKQALHRILVNSDNWSEK